MIFVATATGTAHSKIIFFYKCTQINKRVRHANTFKKEMADKSGGYSKLKV